MHWNQFTLCLLAFVFYCTLFNIIGSLSSNDGNGKKGSLENKHLGNGDNFVIIASSSPRLLLTEHVANGLVEAPLK